MVLLSLHHIVCDEWSVKILLHELDELYAGRDPVALAPPALDYIDYVRWSRSEAEQPDRGVLRSFWREQLAAAPTPIRLPADRRSSARLSGRGCEHRFRLAPDVVQAVEGWGTDTGTSAFITWLALFRAWLHQWTGETGIWIGTPWAGRDRGEVAGLVGALLNTLPLRTAIRAEETFRELLERERQSARAAFAHGALPFDEIVRQLPAAAARRDPLCPVFFVFRAEPEFPDTWLGCPAEALSVGTGTAKAELTLTLGRGREGGLEAAFEYASDRFEPATLVRLEAMFHEVVRRVIAHPESRLGDWREGVRTPVPAPVAADDVDPTGVVAGRARVEPAATPTEAKLVEIWCRFLERREVGVTDDFFAVGGHSLLAVRVIQAVHHEFGVLLPFPLLLDHPRIRDIARAVDERRRPAAAPGGAVVEAIPAAQRTPCFLLGWLIRTEGLLPPEQPLYVLPFPELAAEPEACRIEAIAAECLRVLRSVRPHGPYLLAGYSAAGVVAFEIASQLRRTGETVSLLALIDCAAPPRLRGRLFRAVDGVGSRLGWTFRRKLQIARWLGLAHMHYVHGLGLGFFRHFAAELANVPTIWRRRRTRRQPSAANGPAPAAGELPSERYWRLTWASALYDPPAYDGAITVLATQITSDVYYRHGGDWRRLAREVREIRIPGSHYSCVTDHRATLAAQLHACCREACAGEATAASDPLPPQRSS